MVGPVRGGTSPTRDAAYLPGYRYVPALSGILAKSGRKAAFFGLIRRIDELKIPYPVGVCGFESRLAQ